jgi:phosphatidylserine/phosphatidylglycerophosphate/cardiolipin synthase-like enzyme
MPDDADSSVELVITPPEPFGTVLAERTRCRVTLGVLTRMLAEAQKRVVISAPYFQRGYGLSSGPMADALRAALIRSVNVDVVSIKRSLVTVDVESLRQDAPGTLRLFCPKANITDEMRLGSHAKFCVVDGQRAYVGSANLTGPGLSEHLEMGLLVHGRVAEQIEELWLYSLEIGLFTLVS